MKLTNFYNYKQKISKNNSMNYLYYFSHQVLNYHFESLSHVLRKLMFSFLKSHKFLRIKHEI